MAREFVQVTLRAGQTKTLYGYRLDGAEVTIEVDVVPGGTTVVRDGSRLRISLGPDSLYELDLTNATGPVTLSLYSGSGELDPDTFGPDVVAHQPVDIAIPDLKAGGIAALDQKDRPGRDIGRL